MGLRYGIENKMSIKDRILLLIIIAASIGLGYGLGYLMAGQEERAPIIIEKCSGFLK